jgi:uncharacterized protein YebE (UPF0316 family)
MAIQLITYFIAGVIQDFLATLNLRYVSKEKIWLSVIFSFLTIVVGTIVLYDIVTQLDPKNGIFAILAYAAGIGVGTFLAMKFKLGMKD